MGDPRDTQAWRRLSRLVRHEEPVCHWGYPGICTGRSTTADHLIAVVLRPDLTLVRSNIVGSCRPCNSARNARGDSVRAQAEPVEPRRIAL